MMRLSISNIAWDTSEDEQIAATLKTLSVDAIDIAPSKYFPDPATASADAITTIRDMWQRRGFDIVGMQSLLFGLSGLNIFGSAADRTSLIEHLTHTCRIAAGLRATRLVFGSPRNRDSHGLDPLFVRQTALEFFTTLGDVALNEGVTICLEANPPSYGCNFITTTSEAIAFVRTVNHRAIKLQLDTGTMVANGEDVSALIAILTECDDIIGHIHISEPQLAPLGSTQSHLVDVLSMLRRLCAGRIATIEMLATQSEPHALSIERAVRWVYNTSMHSETTA